LGSHDRVATDPDLFLRAVNHFNRAEFFEAHEAWEDIWREASQPEKQFLQGLIQVAVALHHYSTGNVVGARSLLPRACSNLQGCPEDFRGVRIAELMRLLEKWQSALAEEKAVPPFPKLEL